MVEIEWETDRCGEDTLVAATVTNTQTTPQRVRIATRLDGPTWPPRRDGITAPEWSDSVWEGIVEPGRRRGLGFATPAPPTTPPIELISADRVTADPSPTAEEVLASLSAWEPPADVCTDR